MGKHTTILGISAFYHDSAACLIRDGEIVAAAQEERFTRKKHDDSFPKNAINYCLSEVRGSGFEVRNNRLDSLSPNLKSQISNPDYVVFYEKPFLKFERILETYLRFAPLGFASYMQSLPLWVKKKVWMKDEIKSKLGFDCPILFSEHHRSHAASAFYPSPFKRAAILTLDGVGEWETTTVGLGSGSDITILDEINFPHSLGMLYSAVTYYLGFKVNSGEYKVMGLAAYGKPTYTRLFYDELIDVKPDGSFRLNMNYFNYCTGLTMTNSNFDRLFGAPARISESKLTQREMDIAKSLQVVTEDIMLKLAVTAHKKTKADYLCLAGGVALNCVANGRVLREGPFRDIWIQPAAGDAGGALGAALSVWHQYLGNKRVPHSSDSMQGAYLGPSFSNDEIESFLNRRAIPYRTVTGAKLLPEVAGLIARGKVIGWFQGRMEYGPRALGNRSILGDARSFDMQKIMNLKIKFRESFRPFAPSVLSGKTAEFFGARIKSPYMLFTANVAKKYRLKTNIKDENLFGLDKLYVRRSKLPAITHVDYSARLQTVHKETNPLYYGLISEFYKKTGCAVIINTSFNVRGEPIVCTPLDAYLCFMRTDIDYLVLDRCILDKKAQKKLTSDVDWKKQYELD